jgi:hypothetical protein
MANNDDELGRIIGQQVKAKREAAARARRLAGQFGTVEDRDRALRFADEMDAQADELEQTNPTKKG